jgi:hypothetical protein
MKTVPAALVAALAFLGTVAPASATSGTTTLPATPGTTTQPATAITASGATLNAQVQPTSPTTVYYFEYGRTDAYGAQTPATVVALPLTAQAVHAAVVGLTPNKVYHFRLVTSANGETANDGNNDGSDLTFKTSPQDTGGTFADPIGTLTPGSGGAGGSDGSGGAGGSDGSAPQPILGESVGAGPASGSISVKVPGGSGFAPLAANASVPVGSTIDARRGSARLVTAVGDSGVTQSATFRGAIFKVTQPSGAGGITDIALRGGSFASCRAVAGRARVVAQAAGRRRVVRSLWGRDSHGRFRTHGRHAIATVRGTVWVTTDRCDGTLTRVRKGAVSVRDLGRRKTVLLRAGHRYLARAGR